MHIFGASGSGVTTLGNSLSERLNVPYFDSDAYYWEKTEPPYTHKRVPVKRNALMLQDLGKQPDWILGGSIISWWNELPLDFNLVVFLYLPHEIRMQRLKKREYERYGSVIYSDPLRSRQSHDFLAWAADYDHQTGIATRTLQAHEEWLKHLSFPVLRLTGDLSVEERMNQVLAYLGTVSSR